jgi:hypothetical protein
MTPLECELLLALAPASRDIADAQWLAPKDFGGGDGSGHATRATRMVDKDWVERRYRGSEPGERPPEIERGSCLYRITALGLQAAYNHLALTRRAVAA